MPTWVSLLRGVNLGARNRVNMPKLRETLAQSGFDDVRSYVQSGNVVARSPHRSAAAVSRAVHDVVLSTFGVDAAVVVRTPAQLADVLAWCPFPEQAIDRPAQVHVIHLDATPDADRVADLLAGDWAPDLVAVRGQEAVLAFAATMHEGRLQYPTALKRLGVGGTARNWRTLQALVDLAST